MESWMDNQQQSINSTIIAQWPLWIVELNQTPSTMCASQPLLITWLIPLWWSMVVGALCWVGASLQQGQADWSKLSGGWMQLNTTRKRSLQQSSHNLRQGHISAFQHNFDPQQTAMITLGCPWVAQPRRIQIKVSKSRRWDLKHSCCQRCF